MKIFTLFGLLFNTVFFILFAVIIVAFAFNIITPLMIFDITTQIQHYPNSYIILNLISLLMILLSMFFAQSVIGKMQREKNIAFPTSSGEVSIALAAVEDLIKKLSLQVPEVKNLRPDVVVLKKKGIVVNLRVDLRTETNIADLTERLQELVKNRIQDMLRGIDEPISVKIHVAKIISSEDKDKKKISPENKEQPIIPFSGYGR